MNYMDLLKGTTNTNAPVIKRTTITSHRDAVRYAAAVERTDDDSHSFREFRALMHNTTGATAR